MTRPPPGAPFACTNSCQIGRSVQHAAAHGRAICVAHAEGDIRCIGKSGLSSAAFGPNWNEEGDRNAFRLIANTSGFERVALGDDHGCGIKRDGTVWCWGILAFGVDPGCCLRSARSPPVEFMGMDDEQAYRDNPFVSVHVVKTHSCARQLQGQVWCWGQSDDGAFGLGPVGDGINDATT